MRVSKKMNYKKAALLLCMVISLLGWGRASAQCPTSVAPVFSRSCFTEYFTSLAISGPGVTPVVPFVTASSCTGTYHTVTSTGLSMLQGSTVDLNFSRATDHYTAFVSVYVDLNSDGDFDTTELLGSLT